MEKLILLAFVLIICVIWDYLQDRAMPRGSIVVIQNQRNRKALDRRDQLTKQIHRHLSTAADTVQEKAQLGEYHYKLFEVFYSGVPDKYGLD